MYGTLHNESASTNKSLPSFHTGSIIKLIIDRRKKDIVKFDVHIDSSGKTFHVDVKKMKKTDEIFVFTSLYNNKAKISIIWDSCDTVYFVKKLYIYTCTYLCTSI